MRSGSKAFTKHPMRWAAAAVVVLAGLTSLACGGSGGSGPTGPTHTHLLAKAQVIVDGQVVNGKTLVPGHGQGGTHFEATMQMDAGMAPARVWMRVERPGGMGMMQGGMIEMHDDGTHGDHTPGDGVYCYQDERDEYGCGGPSSPMGQYHYDFWATGAGGMESNHMAVTVTLAGP